MKKSLLVLIGLVSFTGLAETQKMGLKHESARSSTVATGLLVDQKVTTIENANITVKRHQLEKKQRLLKNAAHKVSAQKSRNANVEKSAKASLFQIYSVSTRLDQDFDLDGYHNQFTVTFDANYLRGSAEVYAKLYLSRNGGDWINIDTTDVFTINGTDELDSYVEQYTLKDDFPTGDYDILIDLFEAGYSGTVDTVGPEEFINLSALPLEDSIHELNSADTSIDYVVSELSHDIDDDRFYTKLKLEYDIETLDTGRLVYASVSITNSETLERQVVLTENFILGVQTETIDLTLEAGYSSSWYDIKIALIDSDTEEELDVAGQDFDSLQRLPIESQNYDVSVAHIDEGYIEVSAGGSGSFGIILGGGLLIAGISRIRKKQ